MHNGYSFATLEAWQESYVTRVQTVLRNAGCVIGMTDYAAFSPFSLRLGRSSSGPNPVLHQVLI